MEEPTEEQQAAMALKLMDNVRELIRDEVRNALEDYGWISNLHYHPLAGAMIYPLTQTGHFREAVKIVIRDQMSKI